MIPVIDGTEILEDDEFGLIREIVCFHIIVYEFNDEWMG